MVLQSASATTYAFPPLGAGACLLDAARGLVLSWDVRAREGFLELQLEGDGEGWLGGGLTRSDSTAMVAAPSHKVLIADYTTGGAPVLVSMEGYEAASLVPVNATAFGVAPTLLQAAGGKLVLRYRQDLDRAGPGRVDLDGQSDFMYAYSPFAYPNLHVVAAATAVHWPSGTCNPAWVLPEIEGYWLLPLLPLLGLLAVALLTFCYPGPCGLGKTLLQRRLGPMPLAVPVEGLRGALFSLYNMKVGELAAVLLYLALQAALLLYWSLQAGPATARSAGIAFGKAALTNTMLAFLPVSKTALWVRACGLPFERAVRFHRWLSYLAIGTMTAHLVCLAQPASRAWYVCICVLQCLFANCLSCHSNQHVSTHQTKNDTTPRTGASPRSPPASSSGAGRWPTCASPPCRSPPCCGAGATRSSATPTTSSSWASPWSSSTRRGYVRGGAVTWYDVDDAYGCGVRSDRLTSLPINKRTNNRPGST